MATGFAFIDKVVLSSNAASITFSSIPATYTDLMVKGVLRSSAGGAVDDLIVQANGLSTSIYNRSAIRDDGATSSSDSPASAATAITLNNALNGNGSTASIFGYVEFYITNYATSSANKAGYALTGQESSTTTKYIGFHGFNITTASAINSLFFKPTGSNNFLTYSSLYLYGIKKS
jgi:hypothetical protein